MSEKASKFSVIILLGNVIILLAIGFGLGYITSEVKNHYTSDMEACEKDNEELFSTLAECQAKCPTCRPPDWEK
jgi:hypothetical protein